MKDLITKAAHELKGQRDFLLFLANNENIEREDLEDAFNIACGYAWAYQRLGFLTNPEAMDWIQLFANACEGR